MANYTIIELEFLRGAIIRQRQNILSSEVRGKDKKELEKELSALTQGVSLTDFHINKKMNEMLNEMIKDLPKS